MGSCGLCYPPPFREQEMVAEKLGCWQAGGGLGVELA